MPRRSCRDVVGAVSLRVSGRASWPSAEQSLPENNGQFRTLVLFLGGMARPCSVCRHPQLPEITVDIADGANDVAIAKRYGLGRSAMQRHRQHIGAPNSMAAAERKSAAFQALASLPSAAEVNQAYASITSRIDAIATKAEQQDSLAVALVGLRELRVTVEAQAKLAGHIGSGGATVAIQTNVSIDAAAVVRELIAALKPAIDPTIPSEIAVHFVGEPVPEASIASLEALVDGD